MNKGKNEGITLIALVITIIVLLIIVGVSLSLVMGEEGLIGRTISAKETNEKAYICEQLKLVYSEYEIGKYESEVNIQKRLEEIFGENNVSGMSHKKEKGELKVTIYGKIYQYNATTGIAEEYVYMDPINYGTKTRSTIAPGDDISIGTEKFKVISNNDGKIMAMPYYNLVLSDNPIKQATETTGNSAGETNMVTSLSNLYWGSNCDQIDMSNAKNNIQRYITAYQTTLKNMGVEEFEVRIAYYSELNATGVTNARRNPGQKGSYWLGSGSGGLVKAVSNTGTMGDVGWNYSGYRSSSNINFKVKYKTNDKYLSFFY